jgi:hypothetical protein
MLEIVNLLLHVIFPAIKNAATVELLGKNWMTVAIMQT